MKREVQEAIDAAILALDLFEDETWDLLVDSATFQERLQRGEFVALRNGRV